ncbi:MAG: hypothetical protein L6R38_003604 [Xanthoria sp. 2 TBL-2021]|nr:MAG: hypothetical protein L6R38_003604 [Xanthoria sp. 2 TBL-2021]
MDSDGSKAPLHRPGWDRQLLLIRILQLLTNVAYVVTIAITSADSGRWTYESIEMAAALGATAATLTFVNFAIYLTRFDPIIHPAIGPGRIKRLLHLLIRIIVDLFIGALWCAAFAASFHRKTTNFQKLFAPPPFKTWTPAVIFTVLECGLLFASAFILLARYRSLPPQHAATRIADGGDFDPSNTGDAIELMESGTGVTFGASIIRRG